MYMLLSVLFHYMLSRPRGLPGNVKFLTLLDSILFFWNVYRVFFSTFDIMDRLNNKTLIMAFFFNVFIFQNLEWWLTVHSLMFLKKRLSIINEIKCRLLKTPLFVSILCALCLQSLSNIHGVMGYTLANVEFFPLLVQQKSSVTCITHWPYLYKDLY